MVRKYGLTQSLTGQYHIIAIHKGVQMVLSTPRQPREEFPISFCGIVLRGLTNIRAAGVTEERECQRCDVAFNNYQLMGELG